MPRITPRTGWGCAAALSLALAACGQGGPDNVMAPSANALPPALVDLALGPEAGGTSTNAVEPADGAAPADSAEPDEPSVAPSAANASNAEPADADAEEETTDEPIVEEPAADNVSEQ